MKLKSLATLIIYLLASKVSAQFSRNEILIGGNLDVFVIREKNPGATTGGPFGSTSAKETDFSIRPELNYLISNNVGLSIFGEILSSKYTNNPGVNESKTKGYSIGIGLSRYKFFTKGFGVFGRFQASYSPSTGSYSDTSNTYYPKDKYQLTAFSLQPGLFYRFSRHFSLQAIIGRLSFEHLISKREGFTNQKKHDQFYLGFSNISFGFFYIFRIRK